jgi:hypothetical protein
MEAVMKTATAYALKTGRQCLKASWKLGQLKSNLTHATKDARRFVRKGRHAAEDFVNEVAVAVQRQPMKSIGITFGLALGVGALAGWLGTRRS